MITTLTTEQAGNLKGVAASVLAVHGREAINEAIENLCHTCQPEGWYAIQCCLLPLTLDGDCPYYRKKESE